MGRSRPSRSERPSVAGERCCKLLRRSRSRGRRRPFGRLTNPGDVAGHGIDSGGVLAQRYQPNWPITNRPPATYRDSTITSQPKPPDKNKSRKTVSADASRDTRPDAPYHVSNARRHRRPARHRPSHRENARPEHLQETRGHQTSRSSEASRERGPPAGWRRADEREGSRDGVESAALPIAKPPGRSNRAADGRARPLIG